MLAEAEELLDFWIGVGEAGWYRADTAVDDEIRDRWGGLWETALNGGLGDWAADARSCLALTILLDQFPRNMFRGDGRSFATDARALAVARSAIQRGRDQQVPRPERQFFYLPMMHSEVPANQDHSVRLYLLNFGRGELLRHARVHRAIIRRFGRFPYRNAALGRESTPEEVAFVEAGGYQKQLEDTPV